MSACCLRVNLKIVFIGSCSSHSSDCLGLLLVFELKIRRCLGGTGHGGFTGVLTRTERLRVQYPVELRLPAGHGTTTLLY